MNDQKLLKVAVQKSGRLSDKTIDLLRKAGLEFDFFERSLAAKCRNFPLEMLFFRASDIPEIISDGVVDCGICGQNSIKEKKIDLREVEKLGFGKCRLSIASPQLINLKGKRIATSHPNILRQFLKKKQIPAEIVELSGSVEIAPKLSIADAICDLVSSGSTLRVNGLQEIEQIFFSEVVLVTQKKISKDKAIIFNNFLTRIKAVLEAKKYKYVLMNAPKSALMNIEKLIPGLKNPTISPLLDSQSVSVASVVEEDKFWDTIEKLKQCGASGILVMPIEKMIL